MPLYVATIDHKEIYVGSMNPFTKVVLLDVDGTIIFLQVLARF